MKQHRLRARSSFALLEALEARQLLSSATLTLSGGPAANDPATAMGDDISLPYFRTFDGHISIAADHTQVIAGHETVRLTATVTTADGSPMAAGTVTFVRSVQDAAGGATRTLRAAIPLVGGKAQLESTDFGLGDNVVWASYSDGVTPFCFNNLPTYTIRGVQPTGLHVELGSDRSPTAPPEIAVTLTGEDGQPLLGSAYAQPHDLPRWFGGVTGAEVNPSRSPFIVQRLYPGIWTPPAIAIVSRHDTPHLTFSEGANVLGTVGLDASGDGRASFRPTSLAIGHHTITISYQADLYSPAQFTQTVEFDIVRKQVTVVVRPGSYAGPLAASVDVSTINPDQVPPSGRVGILCDGKLLAKVPLGKDTVLQNVNLPLGRHTFQAIYYGDANCAPAQSPVVRQRVVANAAPVGQISLAPDGTLTGWAADPDSAWAMLPCEVVVDGTSVGSVDAKQRRQGLPQPFSDTPRHGFTQKLSLSAGSHDIRVRAMDVQTGQLVEIARTAARTAPWHVQMRSWLRFGGCW